MLVDDAVAASDWEQELYRMGVPPEMEVYFHSARRRARRCSTRYRADPRPGILLTGDIATMRALVDGGGVATVNVGGIHHRAGRAQRLRYVFLTPDEAAALRDARRAAASPSRRRTFPARAPFRSTSCSRGVAQ